MQEDHFYVKKLVDGDQTALETLYHLYSEILFNTILHYTKNTEDANEILQDVFITAYQKSNTFQFNSTVKTWLYRIAVNKALDFLRKKGASKRMGVFTSLYKKNTVEVIHHPTEMNHPGVLLENQEESALLFQAIETLSNNQKTAFILTQIDGLSQLEAADIMEISRKAVESLLQRAKQNLKKALEKYYPERGKTNK